MMPAMSSQPEDSGPPRPAADTTTGPASGSDEPHASHPGRPPTDPSDAPAPPAPAPATPTPPPSAGESLGKLAVDDTDQLLQLAQAVGELHERISAKTQSEVTGLFELLGSKRRLLFVNFMSGLARGAGFFLGVTLIGGLIIGGLAFFVNTTTAAIGMKDVTFQSLIRTFAEQAVEAQKVWEDVQQKESHSDPAAEEVAEPGAIDETRTPPPPEDG